MKFSTAFVLFVTTMTIDSEFDGAMAASLASVLDAVDRPQTRKAHKHGKGAGNNGLTQATLGGTPIVDEEKTCNTKVMNFCQKNNLPFDPEFCWDNNKYDPDQTPSCQLDGNDEYICNTEASDYCFDSYPNTGGGGPMYCYDALKHSVGADPACRLYAEDGFICNVAAAEYCMNQGFDRFEACYKAQKYGSTKDPPCPVLQYAPSAAP